MKIAAGILGSVLTLAGLPSSAQDTGYCASLGLTAAQGSSSTLTRQTWGGETLEFGYRFTPKELGATLQPYLGWAKLPGKSHLDNRATDSLWGPNSYDLTCWRAGIDLRIQPLESLPITIITGPSLHNWKVRRLGGGADVPQAGDGRAVKLGWRLGLDYTLAKQWNLALLFTQSEWRSEQKTVDTWPGYIDQDKTPSYIEGLNPSRPAYFTLMATYRF